MKTTMIASGLTALIASTSAAVAAPKKFALATSSTDSRFNNLCVEAYHTGAGTADPVLVTCDSSLAQYFFNGTRLQSTAFGVENVAGFEAVIGATYNSWYPATITASYGGNFSYNRTDGFTALPEGQRFLACEWAHGGGPQLFVFAYTGNNTVPVSTCASVKLVKKFT